MVDRWNSSEFTQHQGVRRKGEEKSKKMNISNTRSALIEWAKGFFGPCMWISWIIHCHWYFQFSSSRTVGSQREREGCISWKMSNRHMPELGGVGERKAKRRGERDDDETRVHFIRLPLSHSSHPLFTRLHQRPKLIWWQRWWIHRHTGMCFDSLFYSWVTLFAPTLFLSERASPSLSPSLSLL